MAENFISMSDGGTQEYCCTVVQIGELLPIEGADNIAKTFVNGVSIVVRKDLVKTGDIMIYASNETQLNEGFLSANNLFDVSSCEKNANYVDIEPLVRKKDELKGTKERFQKNIKSIQRAERLLNNGVNDQKQLDTAISNITHIVGKQVDKKNYIVAAADFIAETKEKIKELDEKRELIVKDIKQHVGFFNKYGRVKLIRLKGTPSEGFLIRPDEIVKWMPSFSEFNAVEHIGEDFDTICGQLFVKAYVPPFMEKKKSSNTNKLSKADKFDRMVPGEFKFHYDTNPLAKNIQHIKPSDNVCISVKVHGTSICIGKVNVKKPIKIPLHKRLWNKFVDLTGMFKKHRITDYIIEYGNVTSSRRVIKNEYINKDVGDGFYKKDIWTEYGNLIYPFIDEGMTVYAEIVGYVTDTEKFIQSGYDYGCQVGKNKLMPYRISKKIDGKDIEFNVSDVYDWTMTLITNNPELGNRIMPINILYHGTLSDLYPNVDVASHWHENVLEMMKEDKEHFGMENDEPLCNNKVPREGIVLRIDDDEVNEAFKLKSEEFKFREQKLIDEGSVDLEMMITYNGDN